MSRQIRRRPQAEADLTDQFVYYLTNAGHDVAERFLAAVEETARRLLDRPGIGARRSFRHPGLQDLRMHPVRGFDRHLIFYRERDDGIELVRVLHGARDIPSVMEGQG
jgi:toxin ParE1/3/4